MVAALGKTNLNSEFKILPPTCFEMHQIKINLKCATNGLCSLYLHKQSAYTRCTLCPQHICSKLCLQRQKQLQKCGDVRNTYALSYGNKDKNKHIRKWNGKHEDKKGNSAHTKHWLGHNGPEGWVQLTKLTSLGLITSINCKISTKH